MGEKQATPGGQPERAVPDPSSPVPAPPRQEPGRRLSGRERRAHGEARFRMLVEHGRDLIALQGADGHYRYVTPSVQRLLGYTAAELVGASYQSFLHPDDLAIVLPQIRRLVVDGEIQQAIRLRFRRKDGDWAWLETLAVPLREDPARPERVTSVMTSSRDITAALQAERALAASEERLQLALRTAGMGILDIRRPSRAGYYSDEYLRIYGYGPEHRAQFAAGWEPLVHPDDALALTALRQYVWRGDHETIDATARRMHRSGRWIWVRAVGRAYEPDERGRPTRWVGTLQDIDRQQRDEQALHESRARLREAQAIARLGDWGVDTTTLRHRWSDEACRIVGYEVGECEPSLASFLARVHPGDLARMTEVAHQLERAPADANEDTRIVLPDGTVRHVHLEIRVTFDRRGTLEALTGTIQDVTERKAVEAALRSTAAELAQAQRIARVGSWYWHIGDGTLRWSPEMFRILGLDPGGPPVPYHQQDRIFLPESWVRLQAARAQALARGTPYEVELEGRRGDGSVGWFRAVGEVEHDESGHRTGIFGTLQDISEHKRAEAELRTVRDQLRELSSHHEDVLNEERKRIALDVHDELGQMLTAMKLQLDLLQSKLHDAGAARAASDKLRALVEDTIEVTRNVAMNLRPPALDLGLVAALEWLAEDFALRSEIPCAFEARAGEVRLGEKVATELFRIVQESLTNVARHAGAQQVRLAMQFDDDALCLSIRDDGRGFDPQDASGLRHFGLLSMRERALRIGAALEVSSRPGAGTLVHVRLPAATPENQGQKGNSS
jgi:PAS domain S-box-containing protein